MNLSRSAESGPHGGWRSRLLPSTSLGRRSARTIGCAFAIFGVFVVLTSANVGRGGGPENSFFQDPLWAVLVLSTGIFMIAGSALAAAAAIKQHERALMVWPAIALGLVVSWFWIGEIVVPH